VIYRNHENAVLLLFFAGFIGTLPYLPGPQRGIAVAPMSRVSLRSVCQEIWLILVES